MPAACHRRVSELVLIVYLSPRDRRHWRALDVPPQGE